MAFEKYILPDEGQPKLPLHLFIAVISEVRNGNKTQAEAKTAFEQYLGVTLSADETTDFNSIFTYIDGGSGPFEKSNRSDEIYRVASLAEHGIWYGTQELLRTKLNWI
jgi:hypothetical protein